MAFARARAVRSLQQALARPALRNGTAAGRRRTELVAKRWASSGGHGAAPSSDLPWLLAGIVVTVPSCYYLWPSATHAEHHGHEESHAEESEEEPSEGAEPPVDKPKEESDSEQKEVESEDAEKVESGEDKPKEDTSAEEKPESDDSSDDSSGGEEQSESGDGGEGKDAQFKGPVKGGAPDERKSEDDSKGGKKRRIDSALAKTLEGGSGDAGGKQKGISNTDTKHSTEPHKDDSKSKKGEGTPETAKTQGAVSPDRPANDL